ncbi:formate dehydrogenase accessory sulfurtransferase FdhD [Neomegalonema sp.]|uniref:formate dehydrogenase accessory sulfurtransferase FdhD n=1 Tax=Neomegalonema sp. TaxID=2039713 RepID=UPI002637E6B5|nr:formate dehydrogenase accessory sulfurtransferase FdhD [Neomegalonema sp.]MDD2867306.1 formate dehydrogenase accessory sulfurtransferase FdhD [Neomegalonema sp.]
MIVAGGAVSSSERLLPEETPIALSFNGSTQAVMMASPQDLEDFAYGFALTEGIARPEEIESVTVLPTTLGVDLQIWLKDAAGERLTARRRSMVGPVGCGLCGIDSLEEAARKPRRAPDSDFRIRPEEILAAMQALRAHQPLHDVTRAVHAAGFWETGAGLTLAREDVGRHNALDKLAGALARRGLGEGVPGALVLTSRVSIDMVQKAAALGAPVILAVSAPTASAVAMAEEAGLTLAALARDDRFEIFAHPRRILLENPAHVL